MMVVESHHLDRGQLFWYKETLVLRVAEEANLRNIKVSVIKSNTYRTLLVGIIFMLQRTFDVNLGGTYVLLPQT